MAALAAGAPRRPVGGLRWRRTAGEGWEALLPARETLERAVEARRALGVLASLPARQRDDLALLHHFYRLDLFVGGFSHDEIAGRGARPRSWNSVNKQLVKARARIRRLEAEAA